MTLKVGPNAQAIVDRLASRPAAVIARESDAVQATFRALFYGAFSPGKTDARGRLQCGQDDANAGWPSAWRRLAEIGLIVWRADPIAGKVIMRQQARAAHCLVNWQITALGWEVRTDDVAWMVEYLAADQADKATKQ